MTFSLLVADSATKGQSKESSALPRKEVALDGFALVTNTASLFNSISNIAIDFALKGSERRECRGLLGRDIEFLARLGVTSLPSLSIRPFEGSKASNVDFTPSCNFLLMQFARLLKC